MNPEEVFQLALALILTPVIASIGYRVRIEPARVGLGVAFAATIAAYTFTVVEGIVPGPMLHDLFNMLQHASYAAAGIALFVSSWALRKHVARTWDPSS